jgi:hypothetical protein
VEPALVEIEEALVPAFIIEELEDGRFTVFVPSVPTPFACAVYILSRERVHPLNVPFTQALSSVSRWGSGSKELVAPMETETALNRTVDFHESVSGKALRTPYECFRQKSNIDVRELQHRILYVKAACSQAA